MKNKRIGIFGMGVMGKTLLSGMLKANLLSEDQVWGVVASKKSKEKIEKEQKCSIFLSSEEKTLQSELKNTDFILLCVKPFQIEKAITQLKSLGLKDGTVVISIAAGITLDQIAHSKVIRAMPNTPSRVGEGMTALCAAESVSEDEKKLAIQIFESVGMVIEVGENHFDGVTALGGSGPAYLLLIMESLVAGGVRVGMPREVASKVVAQTVLGTAKMLLSSQKHPAELRDEVTTPAGCTIGGLLVMEDGKIRSVLARAVEEATKITSQMGKKN